MRSKELSISSETSHNWEWMITGSFHGKEKALHNIQPSEEHSSGGRRVTVKVCNQEKTSRKQIKRCKPFISLKNRKARLDSAKNILKSLFFFGRMKLTSNKMRRRKKKAW